MKEFKRINTNTPFKFETDNNYSLFTKAKIYVMYHGENRNGSFIDKTVVENSLESLKNVPVVCEFITNADGEGDFKGHGGQYLIEDGDIKYIHTTKPVGVIAESSTFEWETVADDEGNEKEYLVCDALLWNRYTDEIETLKNGTYSQSMELEILDGEFDKEKNLYNIKSMLFSALCILGTNVEPCFENAKIITFSQLNQETFQSEFHEMLKDLKYSLSNDSTNTNNNSITSNKKGVDSMLEKLLERFSITKEQLEEKIANFSELSEEELEVKAQEVFGVADPEPNPEPIVDPEPTPEPIVEDKFALEFELSHEDVRSKLYTLMEAYVLMHNLGSRWDFWLSAVYDEYFIALGDKKNYKIFYTKENDVITLGDYVEVFVQYLTAEEKASLDSTQTEFELIQKEFATAKEELESLREFEKQTKEAEHETKAEELFSQCGLETSDYEDIKSDVHSFSLEQIEEKILARVGRKALNGKTFSKQQQKDASIHIPVGNSEGFHKEQHPRYGDLFNN